jgi:predicted short-subunit dehydrogenase-like oxidoreductase (DUF2520 family)
VLVFPAAARSSAALQAAADKGADRQRASVAPSPIRAAVARSPALVRRRGDPRALALIEPALAAIGARPVAIGAAAKTVYHAASVFASITGDGLDAALRAYQAAGIPEEVARALARPLATETLENVFRLGPRAALSGPIARGDVATVVRQQAALDDWDRATGELYRALAEATTRLAAASPQQP